jgi:hypothetical protein
VARIPLNGRNMDIKLIRPTEQQATHTAKLRKRERERKRDPNGSLKVWIVDTLGYAFSTTAE